MGHFSVETSDRPGQLSAKINSRMIERTHERFGFWPERLAADAGYGDAANLAWLVEQRGIEPHVPVFDKSARTDGAFERAAFTYDREDDSYVCAGGKRLRPRNRNFSRPRSNVDQDGFIRYRARQEDCGGCALRSRCTPNMPARKVMRSNPTSSTQSGRFRYVVALKPVSLDKRSRRRLGDDRLVTWMKSRFLCRRSLWARQLP